MRLSSSAALALVLGLFAYGLVSPSPADDGPDAAANPDATVSKTYDIRRLLIDVPDFKGHPAALPGQGQQSDFDESEWEYPRPQRAEQVDNIVKLIEDTVEPGTWKDQGGNVGSIRQEGGNLIVDTQPEIHDQIKNFLGQFHLRRVRVRAVWISAQPSSVGKLLKPVPLAEAAGRDKGYASPLLEVDPKELNNLPGPRFEAQTLAFTGTRARASATSVKPLARPPIGGTSSGDTYDTRVWLDAKAALSNDGRSATVVLRPQAVDYAQPGRARATHSDPPDDTADAPAKANSMISQEFQTAARLPVGRMVLIGSTTLRTDPQETDPPRLFLFVQVTAE
jgi:hypothetical protein